MKPKISPDEYKKILDNLQLDNIYIVDLSAKLNEQALGSDLNIEIKDKYSFSIDDSNVLKINYSYTFTAKSEQSDKNAVTIKAKYTVKYLILSDNLLITKDFIDIFVQLTVSLLLWAYFRELIHDLMSKMSLPPFILPMKRVYTQ